MSNDLLSQKFPFNLYKLMSPFVKEGFKFYEVYHQTTQRSLRKTQVEFQLTFPLSDIAVLSVRGEK